MYEVYEDKKYLHIVMEKCEGGDLAGYLRKRFRLEESEAKICIKRIASALSQLHSLNVNHRDLKLENILLKSEDDLSQIKLCDFGLSKKFSNMS